MRRTGYNNIFATGTSRHVNMRMQLRLMGQLLLIEAVFLLAPLVVCICCGESDFYAFLLACAVTLGAGCGLKFGVKVKSDNLGRKDGALLTCLAWILFSLFGMIPFIFGSSHLNVSEAFFETMSGFTTTGATVIRHIEDCGKGIMLWRALTQWIGGLGIVLFTLTLLPSLNNSRGVFMFHAEVSGITHDKIGARIAGTAKTLWGVYTLVTALLIALLWAGPMNLFESVCHAFAAISTGGFSTRNSSIAAYDSAYVKTVLSIFMFIGGVNFSLVYLTLRGRLRRVWRNDVLRCFVLLITLNYLLTLASILQSGAYAGWQSVTIDPIFHVVSAMTSTGFGAGNFENWGEITLVLTLFMMFFGACAGSTTGGAKIDRFLYIFKNLLIEVKRSVSPRTMAAIKVNSQLITPEHTSQIIAFLTVYTSLMVFGGLVLSAYGFPIVDAFFSSISCISNNGLGAGVTGITGSYDFVPSAAKWVMSFLMLAGRLEIFALIALMSPSFWKH